MTTGPSSAHVTIRPDPAGWLDWLRARPALSPMQRLLRAELGLPTDAPILMSGHQAEFWHPGILAKLLAMRAASAESARQGVPVHGAWLVVDQDASAPWRLIAPGSDVTRRTIDLGSPGPAWTQESAIAGVAPISPAPPDAGALIDFARPGLAAMSGAIAEAHNSPNAAAQFTRAAFALASRIDPGIESITTLAATALTGTTLFRELVGKMAAEPGPCVAAYNGAVQAYPGAHLRPLDTSSRGTELPLWHLAPGAPRRRVWSGDLGTIPLAQLAPKALLMTGLVRLGACDLFVHGLGGERYDLATEAWLAEWLGAGTRLAPSAAVTATRFLPFGISPPTPEAIAQAVWTAHRATHDPSVIGDDAWQRRRDASLQVVRSAKGRAARLEAYRALQATLQDYRAAQGPAIDALRARAASLRADQARAGVVYERAWPFPFYPDDVLDGLRDEITRAFRRAGT